MSKLCINWWLYYYQKLKIGQKNVRRETNWIQFFFCRIYYATLSKLMIVFYNRLWIWIIILPVDPKTIWIHENIRIKENTLKKSHASHKIYTFTEDYITIIACWLLFILFYKKCVCNLTRHQLVHKYINKMLLKSIF